jgi:acyl-CoA reductase-like NAD-dependent aldehyde dehydrogenase
MIETLFSTNPSPQWPDELQRISRLPRRPPFAADAVALVAAISSAILHSREARPHPELVALAYWFRASQVQAMAARLGHTQGQTLVRPRGVVFAIAPSNVDVLFIYAWLLSLLAGNATVVRVSRKPSAARELLITLVRELAHHPAYARALADSWIVSYEHDAALSRTISQMCHARLVWGGDATVSAIRAIPLNPLAVDVGFADRFSMAALSADAVRVLSDRGLRDLAHRFVNDTLWFGQQACSSPRAVIWVGDDQAIEAAKCRFWTAYRVAARAFEDDPSRMMARVADLFALAATGSIAGLSTPLAERPALAVGARLLDGVRDMHSGNGLFVEYAVETVEDIAGFAHEKDQTLVTFGLNATAVERLVEALPSRAFDRIVAPGQANEFSTVWDGADLLEVLTRRIGLSA